MCVRVEFGHCIRTVTLSPPSAVENCLKCSHTSNIATCGPPPLLPSLEGVVVVVVVDEVIVGVEVVVELHILIDEAVAINGVNIIDKEVTLTNWGRRIIGVLVYYKC
jgi:hypothetical protein